MQAPPPRCLAWRHDYLQTCHPHRTPRLAPRARRGDKTVGREDKNEQRRSRAENERTRRSPISRQRVDHRRPARFVVGDRTGRPWTTLPSLIRFPATSAPDQSVQIRSPDCGGACEATPCTAIPHRRESSAHFAQPRSQLARVRHRLVQRGSTFVSSLLLTWRRGSQVRRQCERPNRGTLTIYQ